MPNRTLREGLLRSEAWNSVSAEAQLLFIRLLLIVDDFGCFDGRDDVIMGRAYLRRFDPAEDFPEFLAELHRVGLIIRYSNKGRPFIAIPQWANDFRYRRNFPAPPINVDVRDIVYRGKYGKKIDWRNPEGFDEVSILIGMDGRAAAPQPPEWRRLSDYAPVTAPPPVTERALPVTAPVTAPEPPVTRTQLLVSESSHHDNSKSTQPAAAQPSVTVMQSLQPAAPTPINGEVRLTSEGAWAGVDEAQRLRWQAMFDNLAIPDELDHAGAWLLVHPEERAIYERQEDGLRAYLIRWLLRESRSRTVPTMASADSKGKRA